MLENALAAYFEDYLAKHKVKDVAEAQKILFNEIDWYMWHLLCDGDGMRFEKILNEGF